ncbi:MAG: TonB-dependent receptor [Pseudomonadota bacterium]
MPFSKDRKRHSTTRRLKTVTVLCVGVLSIAAQAADEFGLDGEDYLSELPVVLTVTRLPQSKAELPTAVTVIDREMIEASGAVELTELFRMVAGFQVGHYHGTDGPRVAVTYHGNTDQYSRRMQVLIDGRSVYTWGTGGAEWGDLPIAIEDIERIEVSRGPNGVTYGSNAFLGVINIITRHPSEQQGAHASVTLDDDQYRKAVVRYAATNGDLSYRITGSHKQDDGFDDYTDQFGQLYELNDDTQTSSLNFRGDYRGGVNDYWTVQFGGAAGPREVGFSYDPLDPVRERDVTTHFQQLQWKHNIDSESEVNAQFYHNLHKVEDRFQTGLLSEIYTVLYEDACIPFPTVAECALYPFDSADLLLLGLTDQTLPRDSSIQSERYNLEISHRFRLSDSVRLVWGGELRLDEVTAAEYFDTGESYQHQQSRLFFNAEWKPMDRWVVNVGDMVEQSSLVGTLNSPRLAINRLLGDAGYLRLSAGRAYRTPTAIEENADFTVRYADGTLFHSFYDSSGDLPPEQVDSVELSFGAESRGTGYEVKIFREEISAEISAPENLDPAFPSPHWTVTTVGETTIEGAEVQLKARTEHSLLSFAYANTRADGWRLNKLNPEKILNVEDTVPLHTLNALLSLRLAEGLWAGLNYYSVSPMRFYSGDRTDGVQSADFNISKGFKLAGHKAKLRFMVKDLLGSYHDFEYETVSKRRAYLTLAMDF